MAEGALLLLVDLRVLLFALELAPKPVCTELHHVIHQGLQMRGTEEGTGGKGMDPSSVQGFVLNDVPWEEAGRGQGKEKEQIHEEPGPQSEQSGLKLVGRRQGGSSRRPGVSSTTDWGLLGKSRILSRLPVCQVGLLMLTFKAAVKVK